MLEQTSALAPDGEPFDLVTLRNSAGTTVTFMDWGATWLSCLVPMKDGELREVLLGCATPEAWLRQGAYLGASVGRYANRIANSRITWQGKSFNLLANQGQHQLHGGPQGFDKRRWQKVSQQAHEVIYSLTSAEGDQGFPGELTVTARYTLSEDNRVTIEYRASVDKPCPVNLTNHAYFNLDGKQSDARKHHLQLFAEHYLPVNESGIPLTGLKSVAGNSFDFRKAKMIATDFLADDDQTQVKGYDHAFLLQAAGNIDTPAAHLWSADKKLQMKVYTTAPALQFYSGNYLAGTPARNGGDYSDYQGVALESEFLPDSPNHPEWPQSDCWLIPGETYRSITDYQFMAS